MGTFIANTSLEAFTFDSILDEKWNEPANVTEHPIDSRAPVNDHIQRLALTGRISAIVTMTPFDIQVNRADIAEIVGPNGDVVADDNLGDGVRRLLRAIQFFRRNRQDTFTYIGARLGAMENITLEDIEYPVTVRKDIRFKLNLKQIRRAEGVEVDLPAVVVIPPKAKPVRQCSVQPTKDATNVDEDKDAGPRLRSKGHRFLDWVGDKTTEEGGIGGLLNSHKEDDGLEVLGLP